MLRFRRMGRLQKPAFFQYVFSEHSSSERHFCSRKNFELDRAAYVRAIPRQLRQV
jgi:hypothetical protein